MKSREVWGNVRGHSWRRVLWAFHGEQWCSSFFSTPRKSTCDGWRNGAGMVEAEQGSKDVRFVETVVLPAGLLLWGGAGPLMSSLITSRMTSSWAGSPGPLVGSVCLCVLMRVTHGQPRPL